MKRKTKQVFGVLGFAGVMAMTAYAVTVPAPRAAAVSSVTDTIQVRVVGADPEMAATTEEESQIEDPFYNFKLTYSNVDLITTTLTRRDANGNVVSENVIWQHNAGFQAGEKDFSLNLNEYGGVGYYTITMRGMGYNDVPVERILTVAYTNVDADIETGDDGDISVDVNPPSSETKQVVIEVYDDDGNLVKTETIDDPGDKVEADLSDLPDGNYTIVIIHKDENGNTTVTTTTTAIKDSTGTGGSVEIPIDDHGGQTDKVVITIVDKDTGEVVKREEIDNPGDSVNVDFGDLGPGNYDVVVDYYDDQGNKIDSTTTPVVKSDTSGKVELDVVPEVDAVETIEVNIYDENGELVRIVKIDPGTGTVYVYDADGNLIDTIPNGYVNGKLVVPMDGLASGDYTIEIVYRDANGNIVGIPYSAKANYTAKATPVPDTGAFFQNLNISKEDYLITGLLIFFVFAVVGFGIVARGRRNKTKAHARKRR